MKVWKDEIQLQKYLQTYRIENIFHEQIIPHLALYTFEHGEYICKQGEPSDHLYFLVEGKLKIFTSSVEGKTLILSFKKPLDVIGDIEYIQGIETINTVEAVSKVTMMGISYKKLEKYNANTHPLFLQFLLKVITKKFHIKSNSMSLNVMYPVEVRLASYLLSVTPENGDSLQEGKIKSESITDIANLIGTSYRHLNRVIRKLCDSELLERRDKYIFIRDRGKLKSLTSENIYE